MSIQNESKNKFPAFAFFTVAGELLSGICFVSGKLVLIPPVCCCVCLWFASVAFKNESRANRTVFAVTSAAAALSPFIGFVPQFAPLGAFAAYCAAAIAVAVLLSVRKVVFLRSVKAFYLEFFPSRLNTVRLVCAIEYALCAATAIAAAVSANGKLLWLFPAVNAVRGGAAALFAAVYMRALSVKTAGE